jgi:ABC-2 type transport system permease protein
MSTGSNRVLAGTSRLAWLAARRDRIWLPAWVLILSFLPASVAQSFAGLYGTEAARRELVSTIGSNPGLVAILGPIHGSSIGAITTWRVGTIGALLVALMAVLTVIRHTRDDEETGRRELLGSTVVGRHAPLAAALLVTTAAGMAIGGLVVVGLLAVGQPAGGSIAFGLGWWLSAVAFAGVGAVAAQLTESSGAARGIAVAAVGLVFMLRLAGDGAGGGAGWLSWLSPIGWFTNVRAFAGERWWVLLLLVGLGLAGTAVAVGLSARRDVGAGVIRPGVGPASAGRWLGSPVGLAWRLQRPALIGWSAGLGLAAAVYGGLADSFGQLVDENPQLAEVFERLGGQRVLLDIYFDVSLGVLALLVAAFAVRSVLRLRAEEESLRADCLLATATPRLSWAGSHLLFALLAPAGLLALAGLVSGVAYGLVVGDVGGEPGRLMRAALLYVPAVWVTAGVAAALFGLVPRMTGAAWAVLVGFVLLGQLGQALQLPQWALDLSPFTHVPPVPEVAATPLVWSAAVAAGLIAAGLAGFARRDLT